MSGHRMQNNCLSDYSSLSFSLSHPPIHTHTHTTCCHGSFGVPPSHQLVVVAERCWDYTNRGRCWPKEHLKHMFLLHTWKFGGVVVQPALSQPVKPCQCRCSQLYAMHRQLNPLIMEWKISLNSFSHCTSCLACVIARLVAVACKNAHILTSCTS
jgi:hypothetical protein